jgi:hypothetical protein
MRKMLIFALAAVLCVSLVACAGEPEGTTAPTAPSTTAPTPTEPFEITFDPEREDLPNRTTAEQISEGMYISEVFSIMGLPQKGYTHNSACKELVWPLEAWELLVVFARKQSDTGAWYVEERYIVFDVATDPDRQDLPSRASAEQITEGMRINEVYAIVGVPQRRFGSGKSYLEWDLETGETLVLTLKGVINETDELNDVIAVYDIKIR